MKLKFEYSTELKNKIKELCPDYTELISLVERKEFAQLPMVGKFFKQ